MERNQCITDFKVVGRRAPKVTVFLDGEEWATLEAETVVREGLRRDDRLDEARREAILAADAAIRARRAAAGHAAAGPKTRREIEAYLRRRGFGAEPTRAAVETLEQSGTIDDERTAERIVRARRRRSDIGPLRLEAELIQRGLSPDLARHQIDRAFAEVDLVEECTQLAKRAAGRYKPLEDARQRQKLHAWLARRGYDAETIGRAIERITGTDFEA